MKIDLGDQELRRLEELARREGRALDDLATEILQDGLAAREQVGTWVDDVAGSFEGDPEFEEVVRLGRELREAERPAPPG